jgi:tetratricopeptide (TPR) repeat protein
MQVDPIEEVLELVADSAFAQAYDRLSQLIREEPFHPAFFALRALVLLDLARPDEARDDVIEALELSDQHPFVQYAAAAVALSRGEVDQAIHAAARAHELAPGYLDAILLEARAHSWAGQWGEVERLATVALEIDHENEQAAVLMALAKNRDRPGPLDPSAWQTLSARFPLNSTARTAAGWTRLRSGEIGAARTDFEQALALDPDIPWAREGLALALKARSPVYALLLRYFTWTSELSDRTRNGMVIGAVLGFNLLRYLAQAYPALEPLVWPVLIIYGIWLALTWLSDPLLDLTLLARAETRRLVDSDDRRAAILIGTALGLALLLGLAGALTSYSDLLATSLCLVLVTLPIKGAYSAPPSDKRDRLLVVAAVALTLGVAASLAPEDYRVLCLGVSILLSALSTWYSRLGKAVPQR